MSLRIKKIPATRGCIYDSEGIKLAWTERYYSLYLNLQDLNRKQKNKIYYKLKKIFPNLNKNFVLETNKRILVKKYLAPNELKSSLALLNSIPSLNIKLYFLRHNIDIPEVKKYIGNADFINGKWVGISGIEKTHNSFLNGSDGLYTVMLDKKGQWVSGTSSTKKIMIPGNDFYLKEGIEDIIRNTK